MTARYGTDSRHRLRPDRYPFFRPPTRTGHTLLYGDVGTLQLLRNARAPDSLHDGCDPNWRLGFFGDEIGGHLWLLHCDGVSAEPARGLGSRSYHRATPRCALRRHPDLSRKFLSCLVQPYGVL